MRNPTNAGLGWKLSKEIITMMMGSSNAPGLPEDRNWSHSGNDEAVIRHWSFRWGQVAEKYKTDLDTYIWRPHCYEPTSHRADFVTSIDKTPSKSRVLVLFSSLQSLRSFSKSYHSLLDKYSRGPSPTCCILPTLHSLFETLIDETETFFRDASKQVSVLVSTLAILVKHTDLNQ